MGNGQQANESDGRDTVRAGNERPPSLVLISVESDERCANNSHGVDGNREKLGLCGSVAETKDDAGCSIVEAVN